MAKISGHLDIPSVSSDDLLSFQSRHFGSVNPTNSSQAENDDLWDGEQEADLGYYSDGTARTLTNEQIAIFRHSEIEQLIKSYNAYLNDIEEQDDEEDMDENMDEDNSKLNEPLLDFSAFAETLRQKHIFDQARKYARSKLEQDTAQVQTQFSPKSREEKKLQKRRNRNKRRKLAKEMSVAYADTNDEEGRTFRRIAREQDEQKNEDDVTLDY